MKPDGQLYVSGGLGDVLDCGYVGISTLFCNAWAEMANIRNFE